EGGEPLEWSAPENLEQVQRGSLGLLRREVVICAPPPFADFLLRWQGAHPATRKGGADGLAEALGKLEGLPLPAGLWEQTVLAALAADTGLSPGSVRAALWALARRAMVTNDHFDVVRRGEEAAPGSGEAGRGPARPPVLSRTSSLRELRRRAAARPEGRWSV